MYGLKEILQLNYIFLLIYT